MDNLTYAWFDLETTGLDVNTDAPLEIGVRLTDQWGFGEDAISLLVWEDGSEYYQNALSGMIPYVYDMHEKNGLWRDLDNETIYTRTDADKILAEWIEDRTEGWLCPMAGNSIGSLDRPFVQKHFPKTNGVISYRNVDMSSLKEILSATNPTLFEELKPIISNKDAAPHRVLGDISAAIAEYRAYLDKFLRVDMQA